MQNVWSSITNHHVLERLEAEQNTQSDGPSPSQHSTCISTHHGDQIDKGLGHGGLYDIHGPHMMGAGAKSRTIKGYTGWVEWPHVVLDSRYKASTPIHGIRVAVGLPPITNPSCRHKSRSRRARTNGQSICN